MLSLQAILITSSLLLVVAMVGSLMLLTTLRERVEAKVTPVETQEPSL
jgi:hypothetical protein